jgi:hypothetical protein
MKQAFLRFMKEEVKVAPKTGQNRSGEPTFGSDITTKARIVRVQTKVLNEVGEQVISDTRVTIVPVGVTTEHRVTMPDGKKPKILAVEAFTDENGLPHHEVIYT